MFDFKFDKPVTERITARINLTTGLTLSLEAKTFLDSDYAIIGYDNKTKMICVKPTTQDAKNARKLVKQHNDGKMTGYCMSTKQFYKDFPEAPESPAKKKARHPAKVYQDMLVFSVEEFV